MRVKIKGGVNLEGRHLETEVWKIVLGAWMTSPGFTDGHLFITSADDGRHKTNSKHYLGEAFDFRIWNVKGYEPPKKGPDGKRVWVKQEVIVKWVREMQIFLGPNYDIVYGDKDHLDHIHAELDPKP